MSAMEVEIVDSQPYFKHSVRQKIHEWYENHPDNANAKKCEFLQALRDHGVVRRALANTTVDRNTVYYWRNTDPEFRAAWDDALEDATDEIEFSLFNQAKSEKNVVATIFYLKGNRAKYRDRIAVDVNALQGEIEQRLSSIDTSTKDIIAEVIGSPKQLPE